MLATSITSMLDIAATLSTLPLFSQLVPQELWPIVAATRPVNIARGGIICQIGERPQGFYYVVSGRAKLVLMSPGGSEKVVDIVGPAGTFGEALIFVDEPCPVCVEAVEDCLLLHIGSKPVLDAVDHNPALARRMLASLSRRLHHLIADMEAYCLQPAGQRIIGYLLREVDEADIRPLRPTVTLPVSKAILASRLNVTPETLSRIFNCLAADGLISVRGRDIHIRDLDRLRACGPTAAIRVRV
jgi:CRP/FNR family transcriptional regulator, dissimilatory nitrate respiration regulator